MTVWCNSINLMLISLSPFTLTIHVYILIQPHDDVSCRMCLTCLNTQNISFACVCNILYIYKTYVQATPLIDIIILYKHHTTRIFMILYEISLRWYVFKLIAWFWACPSSFNVWRLFLLYDGFSYKIIIGIVIREDTNFHLFWL